MEPSLHTTVLLTEAVEQLSIQTGDMVIDATVGGAGHFALLLAKLGPKGTLVGIDADEEALARAKPVAERATAHTVLVHDNFRNLTTILDKHGIKDIDKVLFDLGWSGYQLTRGRGFSFRTDEPLLMTYGNPDDGITARDMVNDLSEESLADLIYTLGEEHFSRGIAQAIVARRTQAPIETTFALVAAIEAGVPGWYKHQKLHPATKTFQALRIGVNDEFGALREGLTAALERLTPGGRIAVITFHSIEDRMVKGFFRDAVRSGTGGLVTRKPILPSADEIKTNPRARSAKLRVFERNAEEAPLIRPVVTPVYAS